MFKNMANSASKTTDTDYESSLDTDEEPTIDISKMFKSLEMECKKYVKSKEYIYKSVIHNDVPHIVVLKRIPNVTRTTESRIPKHLSRHEHASYRGSVFLTVDIIGEPHSNTID